MGPPKKKSEGKVEFMARRAKHEHLNLFSRYHMKLLTRAFYKGFSRGQRNLQPRDFNRALKDEYHKSLVEYAIQKHNKEVDYNAKLAFEKLTSIKTCNSLSCLEYHFFFVARNISHDDEHGAYYAEVHATYPDEHIHVQDFCCLGSGKKDGSRSSRQKGKQSSESSMGMNLNAIEDGSGPLCEKGKQSHESSIGIRSDSSRILSDRIPTPSLIIGPPKNTEGKTLKDCELELKARRKKYEHLNLFSKYQMNLHIKALYNGYRQIERNLEPGSYSWGINFTLEDLDDEYHKTLVMYAIANHNQKVEDNAKLVLEELIYIDTLLSPSYLEYHLFFVANNHSKNDLGGYYAKVKATYPAEIIHAHKICRLSISTPIQMEDRAGPKKTEEKSIEDRVKEYKERQKKYDHLDLFTDFQRRSNVNALKNGYRQQERVKRSLQTGVPIIFGEFGLSSAFTLEDLDDEYHIILVKYAIAKHNKEVADNEKLGFENLISFDTCKTRFAYRYYFFFVAHKSSSHDLGGYFAEVHAHYPHMDISVCRFHRLRSQKKDGNGPSCKKGKQSDESSRGINSNANEDGRVLSCSKGKQSNESSIGMKIDSVEILSDRIPTPSLVIGPPKNTEGKTLKDCKLELEAGRKKYEHLNLFSKYEMELQVRALYNGYGPPRNLQPREYGLMINFTQEDLDDKYHISLVKYAIAKHNKEVEDNAKLAFEELIFVDTCNSLSYLEYNFFFGARNPSKVLGGYYAEVHATYPDEHILVKSFCCLRNEEEDGSGSSTDGSEFLKDGSGSPDGSGSADDIWCCSSGESGSSPVDSGSSPVESSTE